MRTNIVAKEVRGSASELWVPASSHLPFMSPTKHSDLIGRKAPAHSIPGIILVCVSLVVMPILSRKKKKVARELVSAAMRADAKQTDFCVYLSSILLAGLLLNTALGWWWADPVAALMMVPIIAKEGVEGLRGDPCCDPEIAPKIN